MNGFLIICAAMFGVVLTSSGSAAGPASGTAEVLSGETLRVEGKIFQLNRIDAPEAGQICRNRAGKPFDCGHIAKTGLMDLTAGARVICRPVGDSSKDPILAACTADGYDLSEGMVYTGWALPDRQTGAPLEGKRKNAERKKYGLWAGTFDPPWEWRKNHPYIKSH